VWGGTGSDNLADFTAAAVWTGEAMLVWGGCCRGDGYLSDGALYRPE
jgi:hypothetical protein